MKFEVVKYKDGNGNIVIAKERRFLGILIYRRFYNGVGNFSLSWERNILWATAYPEDKPTRIERAMESAKRTIEQNRRDEIEQKKAKKLKRII